jgi:hypothetical protein
MENRGIVIIDVYGENKYQTNLLASAIGSVIISQHGLYDGSQDRVAIRMIDAPSVYESWSNAKIISDTGLGLLAGLLIGLTLIVIFPNHKLFEFKKRNQIRLNFPVSPAQDFPARAVAEPAPQSIKEILMEKTQLPAQAIEADRENENSRSRISNPWLDQYYEENLNDQSNQNI